MEPHEIKALRESLFMTQEQFAEVIGIDGSNRAYQVSRYERGVVKPGFPRLKALDQLRREQS